jgi:3-deoxy-manno-octulosonate cytidylyltransferase (CMP-KDO synthetase)
MIDKLVDALQDDSIPMASLMTRVADLEMLNDRNNVKVVVDRQGFALYFSRSPLPSGVADFFFLHIGIYGYQKDFLFQFCRLSPSRLEGAEKLEQLRALENSYRIKMIETLSPTLSVDVPQDIITVEKALKKRRHE